MLRVSYWLYIHSFNPLLFWLKFKEQGFGYLLLLWLKFKGKLPRVLDYDPYSITAIYFFYHWFHKTGTMYQTNTYRYRWGKHTDNKIFKSRWPYFFYTSTPFRSVKKYIPPPLAWSPSYKYGSTLIPTQISNRMPSKVLDRIAYTLPTLNGCTVDNYEWISNFSLKFIIDIIT